MEQIKNNAFSDSEAMRSTHACGPRVSQFSWGVVYPLTGYYTLCRFLPDGSKASESFVDVSTRVVNIIDNVTPQTVMVTSHPDVFLEFTGDVDITSTCAYGWDVYFMGRGDGVPYLHLEYVVGVETQTSVVGQLTCQLVGSWQDAKQGLATTCTISTGYTTAMVEYYITYAKGIGVMTIMQDFVVDSSKMESDV